MLTLIHRIALFYIQSDRVQTHTRTHTAIYLSSCINRWIYTDIHKYTFLICIFILKSCYVSEMTLPIGRGYTAVLKHVHNTAERLEVSLLINISNLPIFRFRFHTDSAVSYAINVQQLHVNKHVNVWGTGNYKDRHHFSPQSKKKHESKYKYSTVEMKIYLFYFHICIYILMYTFLWTMRQKNK